MNLIKAENRIVEKAQWGSLIWFASGKLGSGSMTVGQCILNPGCSNPRHTHPNCEEILYVLKGNIQHSFVDGKYVKMQEGDTITVPAGVPHNASNIGNSEAVLAISFSSPVRLTIGE